MKNLRFALFALFVLALAACSAQPAQVYESVSPATIKPGDPIPAPAGEVILTVSGKISASNTPDGLLQLDMPTLEKFGLVKYAINDPWLNTYNTYSGVLVSDLLKVLGADPQATTLHFVALDDYQVDIAVADIQKWPILLATQANGAYMDVANNGPTRIIFPFDQYKDIDVVLYKDLSIWNISTLEVK